MRRIAIMILSAILLVSCGSSGKVAKKPVKTYVQPGADLLDAPGVLRAWAVGVSNSEMTAKKKAMASATAELGRMLNSAVITTIDAYCVALGDEEAEVSKTFLSQKSNIVSEQILVGVRQIFDQWEPADENGMHKNYVVLELSAEEFIKKLIESINQSQNSGSINIDEKRLGEIFIEQVNSGK
jgi:hypothetical protein